MATPSLHFPNVPFGATAPIGPVLDRPPPPTKPPAKLGFGPVCFRAVATITLPEVPGWKATVRGYDKSPQIAQEVESACKMHARSVDQMAQCSEAVLTMLKNSKLQCEGEIYFDHES